MPAFTLYVKATAGEPTRPPVTLFAQDSDEACALYCETNNIPLLVPSCAEDELREYLGSVGGKLIIQEN